MTKRKRKKGFVAYSPDTRSFEYYRKQPTACTYIVEAEGTGLVKIGRTAKLGQRLGQLRGQSPVKITLLRRIKGVEHEAILHRNLKQFRSHGEWFYKTPELIAYVNGYLRSNPEFTIIDHRPVTSTRNLDRNPGV